MRPPSRGPKILMTTDAVGGVFGYSVTLARTLAARGCRVHLVVTGPAPRLHQRELLAALDGVEVEVLDLALEWLDPDGADLARAARTLAVLARRVAPDVVHLNSYREAQYDWPAPVVVVAHSCVTSWWRACRAADPDEPRWRTYAAHVAGGLAAADVWVAPTAAHRAMVRALHRPPRHGLVIWNGIKPLGARPAKEAFILAAGRLWDEAKNIAVLARAGDRVAWPVRIAGPTTSPDAAAGRQCVEGRVELLGELHQHALHAEMRRAAIFAAPALYEPFGLAVAEAASAGCALVLSDISSLRELWEGAALFIDPKDPIAVANGCERLRQDEALRLRLQRAAVARARRYAAEPMADASLNIYRDLRRSTRMQADTAEMPA